MKVKMYLFPDYVSLNSSRRHSPRFFEYLDSQGVELEECHWEGTIDTVPTRPPAIIRASTQMMCNPIILGQVCTELGHLCFYDDALVTGSGKFGNDQLSAAAKDFLAKLGSSQAASQ